MNPQPLQTDKLVMANQTDIVVHVMTDVVITRDDNIRKKEDEKLEKCEELKKMWMVNITVVPLTIHT